MSNERRLLTIAIPTYNCAHFLPDAIASIMCQGLKYFEIVIVDNASEDNTEEIIRSLNNEHIRYIRNPLNLGSRENFNQCIKYSSGFYIKFLCADDVLLAGVLLKQLSILESRPEVSLVTCDLSLTDSELREEGVYHEFPGECSGAHMINLCLSGLGNYIGGPSSTMFRRKEAESLIFDSSYRWVADLKFGLQLLQRGDYVNIDEVGYRYRRHPNTDTATNCPNEIRMSEYFRLVDEFNWWNPLNCLQAIRRGSRAGREIARKRWWRAGRPRSFANALMSFRDVLFMRSYFKRGANEYF